jgi:hypothetical protein
MSATSTTVKYFSTSLPTLHSPNKRPHGEEKLVAAPAAKKAKFDGKYDF